MQDKFSMSVDLNQSMVRRDLVNLIWKSANLEGIAVTLSQTQDVVDGLPSTLQVKDVITIYNLKRSWVFLLETAYCDCDFDYLCRLNYFVGAGLFSRAGFLRTIPVTMGGTTWVPDFPVESVVRERLEKILQIECITERAIYLMLYCMRAQLFLDGNKRTAMLAANQILISHGKGYIDVDLEIQNRFREMLIHFYETNEYDEMVTFIYDSCLKGVIEKVDSKADAEHLKMLDIFNFVKRS